MNKVLVRHTWLAKITAEPYGIFGAGLELITPVMSLKNCKQWQHAYQSM
jgi:hypothetical protein